MTHLKSKPSSEKLRKARACGFRAKRPKKPNAGATINGLNGYVSRYNAWVSKVDEACKRHDQIEKDKATRERLKQQIRNH